MTFTPDQIKDTESQNQPLSSEQIKKQQEARIAELEVQLAKKTEEVQIYANDAKIAELEDKLQKSTGMTPEEAATQIEEEAQADPEKKKLLDRFLALPKAQKLLLTAAAIGLSSVTAFTAFNGGESSVESNNQTTIEQVSDGEINLAFENRSEKDSYPESLAQAIDETIISKSKGYNIEPSYIDDYIDRYKSDESSTRYDALNKYYFKAGNEIRRYQKRNNTTFEKAIEHVRDMKNITDVHGFHEDQDKKASALVWKVILRDIEKKVTNN